jgi:hypothetical protein
VPFGALHRRLDASLASDSQFDRRRHRRRITVIGALKQSRNVVNVARLRAHDAAHRGSEHHVRGLLAHARRRKSARRSRSKAIGGTVTLTWPLTWPLTVAARQLTQPLSLPASQSRGDHVVVTGACAPRDDVSARRHRALWWSMIFSENRCPLFGIMLGGGASSFPKTGAHFSGSCSRQRPSFSFSSALTACGFALPPDDFIT